MKILIADDEQPKLASIADWLSIFAPKVEILTSRSVRSTIHAAISSRPDLILLDMSLPTFDIAQGETGGRPQGFGGAEVLRHLEFYELLPKVIVITQYEGFESKGKHVGLRELGEELRSQHGDSFVDCVYFSAVSDEWKLQLGGFISQMVDDKDANSAN